MQKGDFVWIDHFGPHPAVVWDPSDPSSVVVVYGTGSLRDPPRVGVPHFTRAGKALRLTKPTYFYATNVVILRESLIRPSGRRCPPGLMLELEELLKSLVSES